MLFNRMKHDGPGIVSETGATAVIEARVHANKQIMLAAAAQAVTLPKAVGSGDVYTFVVTVAGAKTIKVPDAAGSMAGNALIYQDGGDTVVGFEAVAGTTDTVTLNGTTTSGTVGTLVTLRDIGADSWHVTVEGAGTGVEATPFSATV